MPNSLSIRFDKVEVDRIETIKAKTGIKNTTDIVRNALMEKYQKVMGSPSPRVE